jgi:uncharacterized protein Yka (UPF0111/DUF47 family)
MDEISKGELAPTGREDIELVKKVDMMADRSQESTRVLSAPPIQHEPQTIKQNFLEMIGTTKGLARLVQEPMNKMFTEPEETSSRGRCRKRRGKSRRHP